jgi:DNA-binding LytR/AlgR family response regulator
MSKICSGTVSDSAPASCPTVAKAAREELRTPIPPVVSGKVHLGQAIAPLEEGTADAAVGTFSNEPMREPPTVAFWQRGERRTASFIEPLPQLHMPATWKSARIAIKDKRRILLIDPVEVIAVEAKGNYVLLHRTSGSHMLLERISTMEEKLSPHGFVRIHRSVLVNAVLVEEIQPRNTGDCVLRVRGGRKYTVTRTYKKNLQHLAQLWIGTDGFVAE